MVCIRWARDTAQGHVVVHHGVLTCAPTHERLRASRCTRRRHFPRLRSMVERQDVWTLSDQDPFHPTILWYERAVRAMRMLDSPSMANPRSWRHLAAVHEAIIEDSPDPWPAGATWDECQHHSWFFLPWHRIYLTHFERIVRAVVLEMGGPADWALPYWNYSDPTRTRARGLPPAFLRPQLADGSANALFTSARNAPINAGGLLSVGAVNAMTSLTAPAFVLAPNAPSNSAFGGPRTPRQHAGTEQGAVEDTPHGSVHGAVGGFGGWMSRFDTAALDPIFWLHHCNIDRLWEVWRNVAPTRQNPSDSAWQTMRFEIGSGPDRTTLTVGDVLDPSAPPLEYRYSDISAPSAVLVAANAPAPMGMPMGDVSGPSTNLALAELVGVTDSAIPLQARPSGAVVSVQPAVGPQALDTPPAAQRLLLKIENVRGQRPVAPQYIVRLNVASTAPSAVLAAHEVGRITLFGVPEASRPTGMHGDAGRTYVFDITDLARQLRAAGQWDERELRITFTPDFGVDPDTAGEGDPQMVASVAAAAIAQLPESDVAVGRVGLYRA
ncbi:MAG: tyrosinase family protein [Gemmatimonas sp.]